MSYDIDAKCPHCRQVSASMCPTYNLSKMFGELGMYPNDFAGKPAREYAAAMADALHKLNTDFARYDALSAPNGWGTAEQVRQSLPGWIKEFEAASECCVVEVS